MLNNKFLLSSFISVADNTVEPSSLERSALYVICFFLKMNKILKIIKILNDFYNVVSLKELGSVLEFSSFIRSKELDSVISLIFSFIFSYIFFSVIILENSSLLILESFNALDNNVSIAFNLLFANAIILLLFFSFFSHS